MCNDPAKFHKNLSSVLEELRSQIIRTEGRTDERRPYCHSVASRQGDKKGIWVEYISLLTPEITEFKRMGGRH